jgi:hypothetical protein
MTVTAILWVVCGACAALSATLGIILAYHWFRFAHQTGVAILALTIYCGVCAAILSSLVALIALINI